MYLFTTVNLWTPRPPRSGVGVCLFRIVGFTCYDVANKRVLAPLLFVMMCCALCVHLCEHVCMHVCMFACVHVYMHVHVCMCMFACFKVYMRLYVYMLQMYLVGPVYM